MDLGRYSSEERPAPSGAGPDIICRRSAFLPWTCDGFRSSVHSGVTGPQQNYGPATQIPPTGDDAISDSSWNVNYIKKQPGFCIEPSFGKMVSRSADGRSAKGEVLNEGKGNIRPEIRAPGAHLSQNNSTKKGARSGSLSG